MKSKLISGIVAIVILGGVAYGGYTYMNKALDKGNTQSRNGEITGNSVANTNNNNVANNTSNTSSNLNNSDTNATQNADINNSSSNNKTTNNSNSNSQSQGANNSANVNVKNQNTDKNAENNVSNKNSNANVASMNNSQASSNESKDTTKVNENSASDLQPNNNAEVSKYFGTWVVGKDIGYGIGNGEKYRSYTGDKIVITKDLFSYQGTVIKNPIYYLQNTDAPDVFGHSQYVDDKNVPSNLQSLMVAPSSKPYAKKDFEYNISNVNLLVGGNQFIAYGGGEGHATIYGSNKVN